MKSQFTKKRLKKFLSYYRPYRNIFVMDMFFAALSAIATLLFPLLSGYITGQVLSEWTGQTEKRLILAGIGLLVLLIIRVTSNVIYAYFGHAMGAKMEADMREELFVHYEALPFSFHAKNSVGKLMTVISNDLNGMTELFHHGPEDLMMTLIKFVGAFVILMNIHIPLTIIVFAVLPVLTAVALKTDHVMERQLVRAKTDLAEMNEQLEDSLAGIRTVKAFGREEKSAADFSKKNRTYAKSRCIYYKVEAIFY
ncbi:MAG: ABC transporter ATP-binding protein [Lachnospiraceae bacterium]|nr:ABC transporter ATP-binding protein [Lachnospiraceae bacterium]